MKRWVLVVTFALTALLATTSPASAAQVSPKEGVEELDKARTLLVESIRLYRAGDADAAYEASRNAYLDHFEFVEIPLRVRDEQLTLELEEEFAAMRNLIEARAPAGDVRAAAAEIQGGLDDVERTLSRPGLAAPLIAFVYAFVLLFREGLEAVLVVAAILGYLEASRNSQYRGAVLKGVGAAVVASVITFVAAWAFIRVAPLQRELLEGGTAILAVAVLFYVSFWLVARLDQRRWMEFVKARVWSAASTGSTLALAGVGFTSVYREGLETALFYQALISFAEGLQVWVALGTVAGAGVLGVIAWVIFKAGRRIPARQFLTAAVIMVMALSVAFAGNAVRALQEATYLPVTFIDWLPQLPIFLADLTGWHATRETIIAQAVLTTIYVIGGVWTFVVLPARERRARTALRGQVEPEGEGTSAAEEAKV